MTALKAGCERCCSQSRLEPGALGQGWGTAPGVGAAALSPKAASKEGLILQEGNRWLPAAEPMGSRGREHPSALQCPGSFWDKPSADKCHVLLGMMEGASSPSPSSIFFLLP